MRLSRRVFVKTTLGSSMAGTFWFEMHGLQPGSVECALPDGGPGTQFIPNETPLRNRLPARVLGDAAHGTDLARFRAAVNAVRTRADADVIGWKKQVAQHCIQCARSSPSNIHFNWQFLPWHRALLFFHERILRGSAAQHADVTIPYWDWEHPASRTVPAIYAQANQALHWPSRGAMGTGASLLDDEVEVQPLLGIPTFREFGGTSVLGSPTPATFTGPHADVHNKFLPGDMSDLQFSPRDPLFYAHHCNIDRLWSSWEAAGHASPDFGDAKVFFYDEARKWRFILQNDLKDTKKLGYQYSTLMRLNNPGGPLSSFRIKGAQWGISSADAQQVMARPNPAALLLENMRGLERFPADTRSFGLFTAQPQPGVPVSGQPSFVGRFSRVLSENHGHDVLSASINVTRTLARLVADQALRPLRIVALDAQLRPVGESTSLEADRVTIIR